MVTSPVRRRTFAFHPQDENRKTKDKRKQQLVRHRPEHKRGPWRIVSAFRLQEFHPSSEYQSRYRQVR